MRLLNVPQLHLEKTSLPSSRKDNSARNNGGHHDVEFAVNDIRCYDI